MVKIFQHTSADGPADDLLEPDRCRLMAHVGTVGKVVVPIKASDKAKPVRGFERRFTGRIKNHRLWVQWLQFFADAGKGVLPSASEVFVGDRVIAQRLGLPSLHLQVIVAPIAQLSDRVLGKKLGRAAVDGQVPDGGLGTVFAKLENVGLCWLSPGAGRTHHAPFLVLLGKCCDNGWTYSRA